LPDAYRRATATSRDGVIDPRRRPLRFLDMGHPRLDTWHPHRVPNPHATRQDVLPSGTEPTASKAIGRGRGGATGSFPHPQQGGDS